MTKIQYNNVFIQNILNKSLIDKNIQFAILRLDKIHPIISGNKWFKLKYYIADAIEKKIDTIATFGGAYSNHIIATAYACKLNGLKSIGFIRGERNENISATLLQAEAYGMQLEFVSRQTFNHTSIIKEKMIDKNYYRIDEGGYGMNGAKGAAEIFEWIDETYTHIICACGTGTMIGGLIKAAKPHQTIIGISVLKGYDHLFEIKELLNKDEQQKKFLLFNEYHFGGYAKRPKQLIDFMIAIWNDHQLPTDIVYTSKLMYAAFDLAEKDFFPANSKVMVIHSGGLQGNNSLPANTLPF